MISEKNSGIRPIKPFLFSLFLFLCPIELSSYSFFSDYDKNVKNNKNFSLIKENLLEEKTNKEFSFYFPPEDSSFQKSLEKAGVENYLKSVFKEYTLNNYIKDLNESIKNLKPVPHQIPILSF
jgi:hypothetical protein